MRALLWTALVLGLLAVAVALTGCQSAEPTDTLAELDVATYQSQVDPYLGARCATLDCHGMAGRPLRIYSELGLRLRAELREQPITAEEQRLNVEAVAGLDPGVAALDHLLLRKPLALAAGGIAHKGTQIWATRDDPGYRCLYGWMAATPDAAACSAAYELVKIPPATP